jgi:hypothetical protein
MPGLDEWWLIVASGPSLTRDDCEAMRGVGHCVAVNCAVFFVPWADYLFAADNVWWRFYGEKVKWYKGHKVSRTARSHDIERWRNNKWQRTGGNSGHMAIQYAVDQGARNITLLGFDQTKTAGKAHFHADHPKKASDGRRTNMANAGGIAAWPRMMARTSLELNDRGVKVLNLSRQTALRCFQRMTVDEFLRTF